MKKFLAKILVLAMLLTMAAPASATEEPAANPPAQAAAAAEPAPEGEPTEGETDDSTSENVEPSENEPAEDEPSEDETDNSTSENVESSEDETPEGETDDSESENVEPAPGDEPTEDEPAVDETDDSESENVESAPGDEPSEDEIPEDETDDSESENVEPSEDEPTEDEPAEDETDNSESENVEPSEDEPAVDEPADGENAPESEDPLLAEGEMAGFALPRPTPQPLYLLPTEGLVYTGNPYTADQCYTLEGVTPGDDVQLAPTVVGTDAGDYTPTLRLTGEDAANYALPSYTPLAVIGKAKADLQLFFKVLPYTGEGYSADAFVEAVLFNGEALGAGDYSIAYRNPESDFDGDKPVYPGVYPVTVKITNDQLNKNYYASEVDHTNGYISTISGVTIDPLKGELRVTSKAVAFDGTAHPAAEFIEKVELVSGTNTIVLDASEYSAVFEGDFSDGKLNVADERTITVTSQLKGYDAAPVTGVPAVMNPLDVTFTLDADVTAEYGETYWWDAEFSWTAGGHSSTANALDIMVKDTAAYAGDPSAFPYDVGTYAFTFAEYGGVRLESGETLAIGNYNIRFDLNGRNLMVTPAPAKLAVKLGCNPASLVYTNRGGYGIEDLNPIVSIAPENPDSANCHLNENDYEWSLCRADAPGAGISETGDAGKYRLTVRMKDGLDAAKNYSFDSSPVLASVEFEVKRQDANSLNFGMRSILYDGQAHSVSDFLRSDLPVTINGVLDGEISLRPEDLTIVFRDGSEAVTDAGEHWIDISVENEEFNRNYYFNGAWATFSIDPLPVDVKLTAKDVPYDGKPHAPGEFIERVELLDENGEVLETLTAGQYTPVILDGAEAEGPTGVCTFLLGAEADANLFPNYRINQRGVDEAAVTPMDATLSPAAGRSKVYGQAEPAPAWDFSIAGEDPALQAEFEEMLADAEILRDGSEAAGEHEYQGVRFGETAVLSGEAAVIGNFNVSFEPGDAFRITPLRISITGLNGGERGYGEPDPELGFELAWDDTGSVLTDAAIRDALGARLVRLNSETDAVGEHLILLEIDGVEYWPVSHGGAEFPSGNFLITYANDYRINVTNEVRGMAVALDPITNADKQLRASVSGLNGSSPVMLVSQIGDEILPVIETAADTSATAGLYGMQYDLPDGGSYTSGYEVGTEIELWLMLPNVSGAYVAAVDAQTQEHIGAKQTVSDGLMLAIQTTGEKYNIGEGTSIVKKSGRVVIRSNSAWDEYVYVTCGKVGPVLAKLPAGGSIEIPAEHSEFVRAKQFAAGDALTEVLADAHRSANAQASLLVGVDTHDPKKAGSGESHVSLIATPAAAGLRLAAGFCPAGSTVEITANGRVYASGSEAFHAFDRDEEIMYFFAELEEALVEGERITLRVTAPDGTVTSRSYRIGALAAAAEAPVFAEAFGESIVGGWWNEDGTVFTPEHHFILPVNADELAETLELPILAWGGYRIGTLTVEPVQDGLKLSADIDEQLAEATGKYLLMVYDEKPGYKALREDILRGDSRCMDKTIPADGEIWIYAGFQAKNLLPALQPHAEHFMQINEAAEEML